MSEKKVTAIVGKDGKMAMSFEGFTGNSCYGEAEKIRARLKALGIDVSCENIIPKEIAEETSLDYARDKEAPNAIKHS